MIHLQAVFRGVLVRKPVTSTEIAMKTAKRRWGIHVAARVLPLRSSRTEEIRSSAWDLKTRSESGAVGGQRIWWGQRLRVKRAARLEQKVTEAASTGAFLIQRAYRCHRQRGQYQTLRVGVIRMQAVVRGARVREDATRQHRAVTQIQPFRMDRAARRNISVSKKGNEDSVAASLQVRVGVGLCRIASDPAVHDVVLVQAWFRSVRAVRSHQRLRRAALVVQRFVRGRLEGGVQAAAEEEHDATAAPYRLQRLWRQARNTECAQVTREEEESAVRSREISFSEDSVSLVSVLTDDKTVSVDDGSDRDGGGEHRVAIQDFLDRIRTALARDTDNVPGNEIPLWPAIRDLRILLESGGMSAAYEASHLAVVPVLVNLLSWDMDNDAGVDAQGRHTSSSVYLESARVLTRLAAQSDDTAREIVYDDDDLCCGGGSAVSRLIQLVTSSAGTNHGLRVQCALCLGNLSNGRPDLRDRCLERGAAEAL